METAETHYAKRGDRHIGYQVLGDGPIDLLALGSGCNVWIDRDDEPHCSRFDRRLASFSRLIRFDPIGIGLSDPLDGGSSPTIDGWVQDAVAVLDAVGSLRAALFGVSFGGLEVEELLTGNRATPDAERMLATILFTDIVDSTKRASSSGDRRWRELLDSHDRMAARQVHRFGGRQVKSTGDGVLATFDSPARAIQCGIEICDGARQLGIEVRVGLHTGELERRGGDVAGIAVHIASRVESHARPGEVWVSRTVSDLVTGSGIAFDDRGEHELKGVPGTWQLFSVAS